MSMEGGWLGGRGRQETEMCPDRLVEVDMETKTESEM